MTSAAFVLPLNPQQSIEDPLDYLPCSPITEYSKSATIYNQNAPCSGIFLILSGKVKVSRIGGAGKATVLDIYRPDEFFGESAILESGDRCDTAVAYENTKVMTWTTSDIKDISAKRPKLAIALMHLLVKRCEDSTTRIVGFATENIARRLARALIRFAERFGTLQEDGSTEMMTLTHEVLAQYVGTSREIVTQYMNALRRQGYMRYSRKQIHIYQEPLRAWLSSSDESIVSFARN